MIPNAWMPGRDCIHDHIVVVTERPKGTINGAIYQQADKHFVECADCQEMLPITLITKETRIKPLIDTES